MNLRTSLLSVLFASLTSLSPALAITSADVTATLGQAESVASYNVEPSETPETLVVLHGPNRAVLARMAVMPVGPDGFTVDYETGQDGFTFEWDPRLSRLTLTTRDGRIASLTYNRLKKEFQYGRRSEDVFRTFRSDLRRIGAAISDLEGVFLFEQDPGPGGTGGGTSCYGGNHRGSSVGVTRSRCCSAARIDAGEKCSNRLCWGCCRLGECDAVCAPNLGDYFCACGVDGEACG